MVRADDFKTTFRRGSRAVTPRIIVHAQADKSLAESVLVGFVVPKKQIAKATGRNLVKRRLRASIGEQLPNIPGGTRIVVQAKAAAREASYETLAGDLEKSLPKAIARAQEMAAKREGEVVNA
ncbi:ribonuclease P protein component [Boudabousia marimammalium]|uniref:Ribonuclease P protein component n=2 Tax=Boudabousia marimammalium TaxID=156892 RepID=A0A1Q5PSQ6_9ACTO|nr:ribonuclease P protein component [Boudabousia marimammalium]